jgi:hypothetical protein
MPGSVALAGRPREPAQVPVYRRRRYGCSVARNDPPEPPASEPGPPAHEREWDATRELPPESAREPADDDTRELSADDVTREWPASDDTQELPEDDAARELPEDDATRELSAADATRELSPSAGAAPVWAGRATVRPPDQFDRHLTDTREWEPAPPPSLRRWRRWLRPALLGLVALLLAGVLGYGIYLIVQATGDDPVAPVAPTPTDSPTPSREPATPTWEPTVPAPVPPASPEPPAPGGSPEPPPAPTGPPPPVPTVPAPTAPAPTAPPSGEPTEPEPAPTESPEQ